MHKQSRFCKLSVRLQSEAIVYHQHNYINYNVLLNIFFFFTYCLLLANYILPPLRHFLENLYSHWRENKPEKNSCKYTIMSLSKLFILRRIWRGLLFKQWRIERRRKNHRAIRRKNIFRLRLLFLWTREIIRDWN